MPSSNKAKFNINPSRLRYLLDLYKLSKRDFLSLINNKIKKDTVDMETLNRMLKQDEKVSQRILKRIDKIFEKGLTWYISNRKISDVKKSSIFFRKDSFNSDIKFESIKVVHKYEELKTDIQILGNNLNFIPIKKIKKYKITDNPERSAKEVREIFNSIELKLIKNKIIKKVKAGKDREYLKNLIRTIEQLDVFVFEHIEMPRKKNKINFNGFFIKPNIIVIKKQDYLRREIFTLIHEFAHYILEQEEIDNIAEEKIYQKQNNIEKWCNFFAFSFLLGDKKNEFLNLKKANKENNFYREEISSLYKKTFLSYSSYYTNLLIDNKITRSDYNNIMDEIKEIMKKNKEEKKKKFKLENEKRITEGKEPLHPIFKPIKSHIFNELVKVNYFEGNINENNLREFLNIKPDKNIDDAIY